MRQYLVGCDPASYCKATRRRCFGACVADLPSGSACAQEDTCAGDGSTTSTRPPTVALGEPCRESICADGLACDVLSDMCVVAVEQGGRCTPGARVCETGQCDSASQRCAPRPEVGQPCGDIGAEDAFCAPGAYCKELEDGGQTGTCAALEGPGATCAEGHNLSGTSCLAGFCAWDEVDGGECPRCPFY